MELEDRPKYVNKMRAATVRDCLMHWKRALQEGRLRFNMEELESLLLSNVWGNDGWGNYFLK